MHVAKTFATENNGKSLLHQIPMEREYKVGVIIFKQRGNRSTAVQEEEEKKIFAQE